MAAIQFFELHRRPISQRGMQPLAIVNLFDKIGKLPFHIVETLVLPEVDLFDLQGLHETLDDGVVIGVAFSGHADQAAVLD